MTGDLVVDVPPESQLYRQVVRKEADAHPIEIDPVVRLYYVEVDRRRARRRRRRPRRAARGARSASGSSTGSLRPGRAPDAAARARDAGSGAVTVAVHDGETITGVWPGLHDRAYGIAFDVGSTTVAGHLCDLLTGEVLASAGEMNPQIRFGEDLMSRVSYVMLNPGSEKELTRVVRGCLAKLTAELATAAEIERDGHPRDDARRQPDHAPPPARDRPDGARRRTVRARRRRRRPTAGARARAARASAARASTCCRASRVTSAPTRPA